MRPRPETRSQHALRHAFRVWHAEASHRVRLRFAPAAAEEIRERRWHRSQRLTPLVAGGVVLELTVARAARARALAARVRP
ncbi:MAG: WYL domain-containing protein [Kofleriaceae bacterium]|nr:WYL domain-containing protein [Kofleriaceae bacterium]